MTARLRVEFHCHTNVSKDSLVTPQRLVSTCHRKGIDRIVVTDHNSIRGALQAKELAPDLVIVGEEIMTDKGEILAAFVQEEIPPYLPAMEVIERLRKQDAFISVSHPFDIYRSGGWDPDDLKSIVPYVDAVEIFNSRCFVKTFNENAQEFARQHNLAGTVGSDAHSTFEIGQAILLLEPFQDTRSLISAMQSAESICKQTLPVVRLTSRFAALYHYFFPEQN